VITTATAQGRRPYQEDRSFVYAVPEGTLLGVFDGHGGDSVASCLCAEFPKFWSAVDGNQYVDALFKIFVMAHSVTREYHAGSTASVVFIPSDEKTAYIAVLGDSPVIAEQASGETWIGPDHNARSNQAERDLAIMRGGIYDGGYVWAPQGRFSDNEQGLQMTRALGDYACRNFLSRMPEVFTIPLGDWLLVGSDGLLDPTHLKGDPTAAIVEYINSGRGSATADDLVKRAINIPTNDNVTAILWRRK